VILHKYEIYIYKFNFLIVIGNGTQGRSRREWHFHGKNGEIDTNNIFVNNYPLNLMKEKNEVSLPNLINMARHVNTRSEVNVLGHSIVFVVVE
jgi:hypothetical protein